MGPARGGFKKRRKVERKGEENGSSEIQVSGDWWVDFSKRISGNINFFSFLFFALFVQIPSCLLPIWFFNFSTLS